MPWHTCTWGILCGDSLDRRALEKQVHARATRTYGDKRQTDVDGDLHPEDRASDADQREPERPLDGDECEAPTLLEDVEPL